MHFRSTICYDIRTFSWGKFIWKELICVKYLTFCNSGEHMTLPKKNLPTYLPTYIPTHQLPTLRHKTILQTCDNWDTDYNSYNWESEFMTIFVTWQSRVTVDSIRNSCDVYMFAWKTSQLTLNVYYQRFRKVFRLHSSDIAQDEKQMWQKQGYHNFCAKRKIVKWV